MPNALSNLVKEITPNNYRRVYSYPIFDESSVLKQAETAKLIAKQDGEDKRFSQLLNSALSKKNRGVPYESFTHDEKVAYYNSAHSLDDNISDPGALSLNRRQRQNEQDKIDRTLKTGTTNPEIIPNDKVTNLSPIIGKEESGLNGTEYRMQLVRAQKYINDPEFKARADSFGTVPVLIRKQNDPMQRNSANILAGGALGAVGLGAMMNPSDSQASEMPPEAKNALAVAAQRNTEYGHAAPNRSAPRNMLSKMAQDIERSKQIRLAQAVATGQIPHDVAYGEQGLEAPTVAGGMISIDPTDYIGPGGLKVLGGVAMKGLPVMAGIFAGRGAKTANIVMLDKAQEMAKAGIPDAEIWKQTGWFFGSADGKPRFEIPDNASTAQFTHLPERGSDRIAERAIEHPELYTAYPDANNITQLGLRDSAESGSMDSAGGFLTAKAPTEQGLKGVGLHELQHAIQQREGFARGGSPDSLRQLVKIDNMMQGKPAPTDADVYDAYQRLAGEAEARLTQSRMNLTPAERAAQYPYDPAYFEQATGVPLNSLIVRKEGGNAMSMPQENAMAKLIREAQAQIEAENSAKNAAKNVLNVQPANNGVRNALVGFGAGGIGVGGGYYGADYLSK